MISARDNKRYSTLPTAFRFASTRDQTCSCRPAGESVNASVSLLRDFTLRTGDRIMTDKGFRVFRGTGGGPFKVADFSTLANSGLGSKEVAALSAIERAARGGRTSTASPLPKTAPKPAAQSRPATPVALEKSVRSVGPFAASTGAAFN